MQRMKNGKLPSYLGWMAYWLKLWPSVKFGLGVMTNDIEDLEEVFDKTDYKMMNVLGVVSTIKTSWRKMHSTSQGIGLFSFSTEQLFLVGWHFLIVSSRGIIKLGWPRVRVTRVPGCRLFAIARCILWSLGIEPWTALLLEYRLTTSLTSGY